MSSHRRHQRRIPWRHQTGPGRPPAPKLRTVEGEHAAAGVLAALTVAVLPGLRGSTQRIDEESQGHVQDENGRIQAHSMET